MFELRQLEQLVSIAEYGTLLKASEHLYITQPALSRSMQKLEKEINVPLFDHKKGNRISLNSNGELAVTYARMLLMQANDMQDKLRLFYQTQNTISIGTCAPAPLWKLLPLLTERYPNMTVSSELQANPEQLIQGLNEEMYKLIVTLAPVVIEHIRTKPFSKEALYLSVPFTHPLAGCESLYLKDLKDMTLILHSEIGFWYPLCEEKMTHPNLISLNRFEDFKELAKATTLPYFVTDAALNFHIVEYADDRHLIHILDEEANVTYYCSCLKKYEQYLPNGIG